jgi:hypothetical protein
VSIFDEDMVDSSFSMSSGMQNGAKAAVAVRHLFKPNTNASLVTCFEESSSFACDRRETVYLIIFSKILYYT